MQVEKFKSVVEYIKMNVVCTNPLPRPIEAFCDIMCIGSKSQYI